MDERVCLSQNSPVLRVMEKFGGLCMSQAFLFLPCFISFSAKIGTIIPGRKTRLERGGDIETHHLLVADRYELESFGGDGYLCFIQPCGLCVSLPRR